MNKTNLIRCITVIFLLLGINGSAFSYLEDNWPTYMGNNYLTGNNDGIAPKYSNLIWSFRSNGVLYNPVPVNGRVYVVSTDGYLYCLDGFNGSLLWKFKADAPLTRMVVVYRGRVFLPGGRFIYCLDEKTGNLIWARRHQTFGFYGTPTVNDGKIFYGNRKGFYARDINSGRLLWVNKDIYTYGGFPAYWNGHVFTVSKDFIKGLAFLYSLDEKDGSVTWKASIENVSNIYSPVIYDKKVFLAAGYTLYIFDGDSGSPVKKIRFESPVSSTPVFSLGNIFLSLANGDIVKINPEDYSFSIIYKTAHGTQFAVVGSYLYIPEKGILNDIAVVDSGSGKLIRKIAIPEGQPFTFTIARGIMYVPSGSKIYAIGKGEIKLSGGESTQQYTEYSNEQSVNRVGQGKGEKIYEMAEIRGRVYDKDSKTPVERGKVTATTKTEDGKVVTNRSRINNGNFAIKFPKKGSTDIIFSSKGYAFKTISLPDEKAIDDLSTEPLEISMSRVSKGEKIRIESIHFETGKANLEPESLPTLKKILEMMKNNPDIKIEIDGHTDSTGSKEFNMKLSLERANAVKSWLVMNGISESRIETKGFGDTRPIADNSTPEGRRKNRRTEIIIKND